MQLLMQLTVTESFIVEHDWRIAKARKSDINLICLREVDIIMPNLTKKSPLSSKTLSKLKYPIKNKISKPQNHIFHSIGAVYGCERSVEQKYRNDPGARIIVRRKYLPTLSLQTINNLGDFRSMKFLIIVSAFLLANGLPAEAKKKSRKPASMECIGQIQDAAFEVIEARKFDCNYRDVNKIKGSNEVYGVLFFCRGIEVSDVTVNVTLDPDKKKDCKVLSVDGPY